MQRFDQLVVRFKLGAFHHDADVWHNTFVDYMNSSLEYQLRHVGNWENIFNTGDQNLANRRVLIIEELTNDRPF